MKNYLEFINEAKQIGVIYHYTNVVGLIGILNDGYMKSSKPEKDKHFISFTRDKHFRIRNEFTLPVHVHCRLVFDGNKISNNYKIEPYDYYSDEIQTKHKSTFVDEQEERLYFKNKNILPISKYILKVEFYRDKLNDIFLNKMKSNKENVSNYFFKGIETIINRSDIYNMEVDELVSKISEYTEQKYKIKTVII